MKTLLKNQEKKLLGQLCNSGSYFGEYFNKDLGQMCKNIDDDFPIEMHTNFAAEADDLRAKVKSLTADLDEALGSLVWYKNEAEKLQHRVENLQADKDMILNLLVYNESFEKTTDPRSFFTKDEVLKSKVWQGMVLTTEEKNELLLRSGL